MRQVLLTSGRNAATGLFVCAVVAGTVIWPLRAIAAAQIPAGSAPVPQTSNSAERILRSPGSNSRCGSYCLYLSLKVFGKEPDSLTALESLLGAPASGGYSMSQLQRAAESYGLEALALSTTLESLTARKRPFTCIAHLNGRHFALIADIQPHEVRLIDPPAAPVIPTPTFLAQWNGECLLLSDRPLESEAAVGRRIRGSRIMGRLAVVGTGLAVVTVLSAIVAVWRRQSARRSQDAERAAN